MPPMQVPEEVQMAWWRVEPITGDTLGVSSKGWGQGTVEDAELIDKSLAELHWLDRFATKAFCFIVTFVAQLLYDILWSPVTLTPVKYVWRAYYKPIPSPNWVAVRYACLRTLLQPGL